MSQASKAFVADPKAFMKKSILVITNFNLPNDSKERSFDLVAAGDGLSAGGAAIPVYRLQVADKGSTDPIDAYWLAFVSGKIESHILDTSRKIFLTAGLTGCGFAAGSGPTPIVKHIDGDAYRDDEIIDSPANAGMDIYTAANYGSDKGWGQATVFGVKNATGWEFWAQARVLIKDQKFQLRFADGIMPV
ncbi:MAG: hypothetical protein ACREUG_07580 [Steroidobacteraceae bacterium]